MTAVAFISLTTFFPRHRCGMTSGQERQTKLFVDLVETACAAHDVKTVIDDRACQSLPMALPIDRDDPGLRRKHCCANSERHLPLRDGDCSRRRPGSSLSIGRAIGRDWQARSSITVSHRELRRLSRRGQQTAWFGRSWPLVMPQR